MQKEQILAEINKVFCRVLENKDIVLSYNSMADDIDEWDSLNYMKLLAEIENHFSVKFSLKEIMKFKNIGDMCETIFSKTN